MFDKIDNSILRNIKALSNDSDLIDVVIRCDNLRDVNNLFNNIDDSVNIKYLSFINSIACKIKYKNLYKLASLKSVKYITSNSKVNSLIYESKKIINLEKIDNLKRGNPKHTCVVIDTGVYPHIDFLLGKNRIVYFLDLINNKKFMYDDNGHGTFVTGVMSGGGIANKYVGIDNYCNIIVIKALDKDGETSTITILKAMQWILDNREKYNIKVVCMSFGSQLVDKKDPLMFGAEVLWDNGVVVVSACGNGGPDEATVMSPGASKKIITVGSMEKNGNTFRVADFSSRGPVFNYYKPDLLTPGVNIISTKVFENKEFYTRMSGTSVSAPMVAGVASLLFNVNHNYTPNQIKHMIINSCTPLSRDRNEEGFGALNLTNLKLI